MGKLYRLGKTIWIFLGGWAEKQKVQVSSELPLSNNRFSMWCNHCQRDLPAVSEPGFKGVRCTQCGNVVAHAKKVSAIAGQQSAHNSAGPYTRPNIFDNQVEINEDRPTFIEVFDDDEVESQDKLVDCDASNKTFFRIDPGHKTINKSKTSLADLGEDEINELRKSGRDSSDSHVDPNANPMKSANAIAGRQLRAQGGRSFALSVRFAILVVLMGFCFSLWSMAAGHFTGWMTGQLLTFVGIGWALVTIAQRTDRMSKVLNQLERRVGGQSQGGQI